MEKLYGFSSESLFPKLKLAERNPVALGSNRTLKVVLPPAATELAGCVMTAKSAACVPEMVTLFTVKEALPVF